jgi:integrase
MGRRSGQVISRGENRWLVRLFIGRDTRGRRRYHNKTVHGTKKDAQHVLTKAQRDLDLGQFVEPSDRPLGSYLKDWLAGSVATRVTARTAADYASLLRLHVLPVLGDRKLSQLGAPEIQRLYTCMTEQGLSPRTVRYTHAVLHSALDHAVKLGLLIRNPAQLVDLPRASRKEMKVFTPAQATTFLQAASQDRWAALWQLLLTTGMRPGEALALRWSDMDGSRIRIQRNLVRYADGRWELKEPKTPRARRTVTMPEMTHTLLRHERRDQLEERLKAGSAYEDHGFVFAAVNGSPLDWRVVVQRHFHELLKRADLPRIRPYDLRHTSATLLLSDGVNVKVVSERLGHASAALTLDVYAHVTPDMQTEAAGRMQKVLDG